MPAKIFLQPAGWAMFIVAVISWFAMAMITGDKSKELKEENALRTYRDGIYHAAVGERSTFVTAEVAEHVKRITEYLGESISQFEEIIALEKLITTTRTESERTPLHIQDPKKVPLVMLEMSKYGYWHKLRNNPKDLELLKKLLQRTAEVPQLELIKNTNAPLPNWGIVVGQLAIMFPDRVKL